MVDISTFSTYPEGQVHDSVHGPLVPYAKGKVRIGSATGLEVQIYDLQGNALDGLHSNEWGCTPQFIADASGASVFCDFGSYVFELPSLSNLRNAGRVQEAITRAEGAEQQATAAAQSALKALQATESSVGGMTADEAAEVVMARITDPTTGLIPASMVDLSGVVMPASTPSDAEFVAAVAKQQSYFPMGS